LKGLDSILNSPVSSTLDFHLEPVDNSRLANLCGQFGEHLRQIESRFGVQINHRGNAFRIVGVADDAQAAALVLQNLYADTVKESLTPQRVQLSLQEAGVEVLRDPSAEHSAPLELVLRQKVVRVRGANQARYIQRIREYDINFGIGPAGTGKTYLAVAAAVEALEDERVSRIILARPAVEAGERLGFLPGDLAQKIDPYLRPLYDALYEMLGFDHVAKLIERHIIEVAPLAFMRGRTLNDAYIILDEAQNTTREQMKMFLTRIGFGSKVIVTGDVTQTDLPDKRASGLLHVTTILKDVEGVSFTMFEKKDVVRHPLVQRVVAAYEKHENA